MIEDNQGYYLLITILLASFLLTPRLLIIYVSSNLLIFIALILVTPEFRTTEAVFQILFVLMGGALALTIAYQKEIIVQDFRHLAAENEKNLHQLYEQSFSGVAVYENQRLVEANAAFVQLFGYSNEAEMIC